MPLTVRQKTLEKRTRGSGDLLDITPDIVELVAGTGLERGLLNVFVVGSTAGILTCEFEPGLARDLGECFERLAPRGRPYAHDQTWGDANGFSHVRASLQGPGLSIPFAQGKPCLGTWQQVVLAEFDTRPRQRTVIVTCMGE